MRPTRLFFHYHFSRMILVLALGLAGSSSAAPPPDVNYQGRLLDAAGDPLAGPVDIEIGVWDQLTGGNRLYAETHPSVALVDGVFDLLLGTGSVLDGTFDADLFSGRNRYLEVIVDGETLEPRQPFSSVAYALRSEESEAAMSAIHAETAGDADTLDGLDSSFFAPTEVVEGHVGDPDAHHLKTESFTELTDQISDAQVPGGIARDAEILSTVLASDGAGSGLDADTLDGLESGAFLSTVNDFGRSGVAANLFEGTQSLSARYLNASGPDTISGSSSQRMLSSVNSGSGVGLYGEGADAGVHGHSFEGLGVRGRSITGDGVVGTTSVSDKSGVFGHAVAGIGVTGRSTGNSGVLGVTTSNDFGDAGVWARNEGIGPAVVAEGDLFVTGGVYRGSLGPGGGAPFPKPAYDSFWVDITPGQNIVLQHNVGGDVNDYVVDFQLRDLGPQLPTPIGIHNQSIGGDATGSSVFGAYWNDLRTTDISVERYPNGIRSDQFRVRIWRIQ
jgi:hypothetical protein